MKNEMHSSVVFHVPIDYAATNGARQTGKKRAVGTSSLDGACSGDKFVVSKGGQMYDAPESEPNRKS